MSVNLVGSDLWGFGGLNRDDPNDDALVVYFIGSRNGSLIERQGVKISEDAAWDLVDALVELLGPPAEEWERTLEEIRNG